MTELTAILDVLFHHPGEPAVLATLVAAQGSSYRRPGARSLLLGSRRTGSISGGCLEQDIAERSKRVIATGRPELVTYDTTADNDVIWGVGLGCRGVVQVLLELIPAKRPVWLETVAANLAERRPTDVSVVFGREADWQGTCLAPAVLSSAPAAVFTQVISPPPALVIFGAGDDAQPLSRMAQEIGWQVTVADSRAALVSSDRFPGATTLVTAPESMDEHVELDCRSLVVVMTHRFVEDMALLRLLLARPLGYLGILGPRARTERLFGELRASSSSFVPDTLAKLCAPVGLDLGAEAPETIALSILAEIQCLLSGRAPGHLRDRVAAIHG